MFKFLEELQRHPVYLSIISLLIVGLLLNVFSIFMDSRFNNNEIGRYQLFQGKMRENYFTKNQMVQVSTPLESKTVS